MQARQTTGALVSTTRRITNDDQAYHALATLPDLDEHLQKSVQTTIVAVNNDMVTRPTTVRQDTSTTGHNRVQHALQYRQKRYSLGEHLQE